MSRALGVTRLIVLGLLLAAVGMLAIVNWALAPYSGGQVGLLAAARQVLQIPTAPAIIIGDSRVAALEPRPDVLFMGYGGATYPELERMTRLICAMSDVPVVIALGVNDAMVRKDGIDGSIASMERMADACSPAPVTLVQVWPAERHKEPYGPLPDGDAIERLDLAMRRLAQRDGVEFLKAPGLQDFTIDGIHLNGQANAHYAQTLSEAAHGAREL